MKKNLLLYALFGALLFTVACKKEAEIDYYVYKPDEFLAISQQLTLPETPFKYDATLPSYLQTQVFDNKTDVTEDYKAALGRVLFYDKKLSKDGKIACASCHKQSLGFSDDVAFSKGIFDRTTERNSLALGAVLNIGSDYGGGFINNGGARFFWDERVGTVAEQAKGSMTNTREMGMEMHEVLAAVKAQPYYAPLFRVAFGAAEITEDNLFVAITSFVNKMGAFNTKFDQAAQQKFDEGGLSREGLFIEPMNTFTVQENKGMAIYMANCSSCHGKFGARPTLNVANNGLDLEYLDRGVAGISGMADDEGVFKVPALRNIALTAPYMHDGRFATLESVIEHYNTGIKNHPNLHADLKNSVGEAKQLNLSDDDKTALIAFLNTFTDSESVLTSVKFSDPFK